MKTLLDYTPGVSCEAWAAMWDFESQIGRTEEEEAWDEIHQLAIFLMDAQDPEGKLLLFLLDTICAKNPPDVGAEKEVFSVS